MVRAVSGIEDPLLPDLRGDCPQSTECDDADV